jgi:hypothetical protein
MDDFGRHLGCLLYGLLWTIAVLIVALAVLGSLVLAGDL